MLKNLLVIRISILNLLVCQQITVVIAVNIRAAGENIAHVAVSGWSRTYGRFWRSCLFVKRMRQLGSWLLPIRLPVPISKQNHRWSLRSLFDILIRCASGFTLIQKFSFYIFQLLLQIAETVLLSAMSGRSQLREVNSWLEPMAILVKFWRSCTVGA